MSRNSHRVNVVYVLPDADERESEVCFVSPDGRGRVFYDSVEEAKDETGATKVIHLEAAPED